MQNTKSNPQNDTLPQMEDIDVESKTGYFTLKLPEDSVAFVHVIRNYLFYIQKKLGFTTTEVSVFFKKHKIMLEKRNGRKRERKEKKTRKEQERLDRISPKKRRIHKAPEDKPSKHHREGNDDQEKPVEGSNYEKPRVKPSKRHRENDGCKDISTKKSDTIYLDDYDIVTVKSSDSPRNVDSVDLTNSPLKSALKSTSNGIKH